MIKASGSIEDAKKFVNELKQNGQKLDVTVNLGRNKSVKYAGIVTNVYPALFTVSPIGEFRGKTSFSYSELLCGGVKIKNYASALKPAK